jgi:hypothetical protein
MKTIIQEVLLMTNTSFSKRQLCEINAQNKNDHLTSVQQLEIACWNGLLDEKLPEIISPQSSKAKLFLWDVETKKFSLKIFVGTRPVSMTRMFSLDPYIFLKVQQLN